MFHNVINFTDKLHISIFDAVMNHFNKMAGAVTSYPLTAR